MLEWGNILQEKRRPSGDTLKCYSYKHHRYSLNDNRREKEGKKGMGGKEREDKEERVRLEEKGWKEKRRKRRGGKRGEEKEGRKRREGKGKEKEEKRKRREENVENEKSSEIPGIKEERFLLSALNQGYLRVPKL